MPHSYEAPSRPLQVGMFPLAISPLDPGFLRNERGQLYYAHRFFAMSPEDPTVVPDSPRGGQVLDYGAYIQDSWKVAPGLTINAGLRWDGEQTRSYAGQTVLRFENQWPPRIGVVWDPWKNGATKIYAFAGRFSYALPTAAAGLSFGSFTSLETYNFDPVGVTQDPGVIGHERAFVRGTGAFGPAVGCINLSSMICFHV
jgi:hypothetical protein